MTSRSFFALGGCVLTWAIHPAAAEVTPPLDLTRPPGEIVLDGRLDDAGWKGAASTDTFYETQPGDNVPAKVRTQVWFTYDATYFYIGVDAQDPHPEQIRAPFVDRDQVFGTDDNIAVFLDPRNDRRSALELRVNPRGIQGDAVYNDANGNEDFSPDFYYDTAAAIHATGWSAEFRIPFSSLRYPDSDPQTWAVIVWRNYPREYRYALHSTRIPRGSNCIICQAQELRGFTGLPRSRHLVVAPYANAQGSRDREPRAGAAWNGQESEADAGLDLKWNPTPNTAIDATLNPDFSQIEADVAQIEANERFALFFPEKRAFFLEGVDLFDTPIQAVYTRSLTQPRWGLRGTGKLGTTNYTLLTAQDRGGGLVILPGPTESSFALQNFTSQVTLGRLRHDFGASFAGLLFTAREIDGGGHNRVVGPDFQWRPNERNTLTGQLLLSDTADPERPELGFAGADGTSHAAVLRWNREERTQDWTVRLRDYGEGFRADSGFVPAAGFRDLSLNYARRYFPEGKTLSFVRPYVGASRSQDQDGSNLGHTAFVGATAFGRKNFNGYAEVDEEEVRVGGEPLTARTLYIGGQIDPSRRFKRIVVDGVFGEAIDFDNGRVGDGTTLRTQVTLAPTTHLEVQLNASRRWLDVSGGRLFTATVERIRANYVFSARQLVRLVAQWQDTERAPNLYRFPVARRSGGFDGSLLYSFKLNWQTVLFLGLGDERLELADGALEPTRRSAFFKISYAIQK
jgi:hypothetical protein